MYGTTPLPLKQRRLLETTKKFCYYPPPPTESRWLAETTQNFCYYPPPTESRRLGTSHERGPLFRKILDLRLDGSRCRCASIPLYKDWLAVSLINQKGAAIMFSVSSWIAAWLIMAGGAVRRCLEPLMLPELCNCYKMVNGFE